MIAALKTQRWARCLAILLAVLLVGCAPAFDEVADKKVSEAQQKFDEGAIALISAARNLEMVRSRTPAVSQTILAEAMKKVQFASHQAWYDAAEASLSSARLRVSADPATPSQIDGSFQKLSENFADLRATHETNDVISSPAVVAARTEINRQFRALTSYQLLLKSGKKPTT